MIQNLQMIPRNEVIWQNKEWKKILSTAISDPLELLALLNLSPEELPYSIDLQQAFMQKVPMPFVQRMNKEDPKDPLLLQILPQSEENKTVPGFIQDPLSEHKSTLPGLLHKYSNRVLFMLATHCAINCRYCFRREFPYTENSANKSNWLQLVNYLSDHPEINEVILSGGDPLAVNDKYLQDFIKTIERVPHIKRLRIHTRLPVVIPQRVTQQLLACAKSSRLQMVMVTHINHPQEIDRNVSKALSLLHNSGFKLLNQSVLLASINDSSDTLTELSEVLFANNIQPYYLHMMDKVSGVHHFEVSESKALEIMKSLQENLSGFLVPKLVREVAGEKHKVSINLT